nr:LAGLIDADG endonuclease [Cordyceps militaris]
MKRWDIKNKSTFSTYLAGLFEGDGHIWMPNENLKKKHNPRFCITFRLKNKELAINLLDFIGYGFIRYKPKDKACILTITSVKGLKKILYHINGELKTPKIHQVHKLIDWINRNHSDNIEKLSLKKSDISLDSWLAGFIDSDGSFSIQHTINGEKRKISCKLRLEQRMLDPITKCSYVNVLKDISNFLNCNLRTRKQNSTGNEYFTLTASSRSSLSIIINYFDTFPLFTSKYLDYLDWKKAVELILNNKHYTEEGITEISKLKNNMNLKRTIFYWNHLN